MSHRLLNSVRAPLAALLVASSAAVATPVFAADGWLSIGDSTVTEGDSGQTSMVFTIALSSPQSTTVTAHMVASSNHVPAAAGDATGGSACGGGVDFIAGDQLVTIAPNTTQVTASVPICGDTLLEGNETFTVVLNTIQGGACFAMESCGAYGIIIDNEAFPKMSVSDASVREGNTARDAQSMTFTVSLSAPYTANFISVQYETGEHSATPGVSCGRGADFIQTAGTLTFNEGETQKTISVPICPDTTVEPNENFVLRLYNPRFATITDGIAVGTIINDD